MQKKGIYLSSAEGKLKEGKKNLKANKLPMLLQVLISTFPDNKL